MRPVNKGHDRGQYAPYQDAQKPLIAQLGSFCSYCERWIPSGIHVEHKLPKNDYPLEKTNWSNFLLSCLNCNSGKGSGQLNLPDYLWPDSDNTFLAFAYDCEGRISINSPLNGVIAQAAEATRKMLGLNRHPDSSEPNFESPTEKDLRWLHRKQAWKVAQSQKESLDELSMNPNALTFKENAASFSVQRGMFSVWMKVFEHDPEMRKLLIKRFTNTAQDCFDANGVPVTRPGGQI